MNKTIIKKELDKLVAEAISGEKVTKKAQGTSKTQNKAYYKDVEKKMSEYDGDLKQEDENAIEPKKTNIEGEEKEYHDDMEIRNGQEMIEYDREPSDMFKDRAKKALEGDSSMGNATYEGDDNGNTEEVWGASGGKHIGKEIVKAAERSKEKRDVSINTVVQFGDDIEITDDNPNKARKKIATQESMKRIKFKKPFEGVGNALKLIPEAFKVDQKEFEMTDGKETFRVKWQGSLTEGKAKVLTADSQGLVKEDFEKIKHLMGYKAQNTLGVLDGNGRIQENQLMKKSVNLLFEEKADKDYDGDGEVESPEDEYMGSKDKAIKKAMSEETEEITEGKECRCEKCDCVMTEAEYAKSHVCEACSK